MKKIHQNKGSRCVWLLGFLFAAASGCGSNSNPPPTSSNSVTNSPSASPPGSVVLTSVNGGYSPSHPSTFNVHPGDVITFAADTLDRSNGNQPQHTQVDNFFWSGDDATNDYCDAGSPSDCLAASHFQANNYGVAFYVPTTMGKQIVITVRKKGDLNNYDSIILINIVVPNTSPSATPTPTPVVVTDPSHYHRNGLDPDDALYGQGNWVYVHGKRYWVPHVFIMDGEDEWTPYQNGYWSHDANNLVIWISFDPWGWLTDHYGCWRFHNVYGWIWAPFEGSEFKYHAHCVSWFDDGQGFVGWYPYFNSDPNRYADKDDQGFQDGYWLGFDLPRNDRQHPGTYHTGYTVVPFSGFVQANVVTVYVHAQVNGKDNPTFGHVIDVAVSSSFFGATPRANIFGQLGPTPISTMGTFGSQGTRALPSTYSLIGTFISSVLNFAVGSVIDVRSTTLSKNHGKPVDLPPTSNGRGIANPPLGLNNSGAIVPLPPLTLNPATANPQNPLILSRPNSTPPKNGGKPSFPGFNGHP